MSWVGYLGYACRTDLPGRPAASGTGVPDAVWMRVRGPWVIDEPEPAAAGGAPPLAQDRPAPPVPLPSRPVAQRCRS